jgi:hypothetical protein
MIVMNGITIVTETKCPKFRIFLTPNIHLNSRYLYYLREKFKQSGISQRKTTRNGSKKDMSDSSYGAYCVPFFSQSPYYQATVKKYKSIFKDKVEEYSNLKTKRQRNKMDKGHVINL